ncbi:MAG: hypothetical protein CMH53_07175, partial [Myxococcales bacterium]|nr:hypothetical protein [Myxococcales bacterium]
INSATLCPSGVAMIDAHISFLDGFIGALTVGVYTPKTVVVVCAAGDVEVSDASRPLRVGVMYDNNKRVVSAAMQTTDGRMFVAKGDKMQEVTP